MDNSNKGDFLIVMVEFIKISFSISYNSIKKNIKNEEIIFKKQKIR